MINNDLIHFFEEIEEDDNISMFEAPSGRPYSCTWVEYNRINKKFHKVNFRALDEENAKEFVINYFTGQTPEEWIENYPEMDTDEILEQFSNSDYDIIDICYENGDIVYQGAASGDNYDPEEDEVIEENDL